MSVRVSICEPIRAAKLLDRLCFVSYPAASHYEFAGNPQTQMDALALRDSVERSGRRVARNSARYGTGLRLITTGLGDGPVPTEVPEHEEREWDERRYVSVPIHCADHGEPSTVAKVA
jgi:hypothetical protein